MQFLNPLFLIGSLAVIGPILFHLVRKEESRKLPFSSLMFVTKMPKKSLRRQELKHLLLLLMRIAGLLLLILAFSRPYFTSKTAAPIQRSSNRSIVILLDNSFSLRSGDRFEKARDQATKLVRGLDRGDTAQIVTFSDTAQVLNNTRSDRGTLQTLIRGLKPSFRKTNYGQAFKLASQLLASAPNEVREIHWISDFQASGWNDSQGEITLGEDIKIQTYDVTGSISDNTAVSQVQVHEIWKEENPLARVLARVSAYNLRSPVSAMLKLELNGKLLQQKQLSFGPDGSASIEFENFSIPPGVSTGRITLDTSDSLPADNVLYFSLSRQKKVKLLMLSEKGSRDNFYLVKAFGASPDSPFNIELQDSNSLGAFDLTSYAAILINDIETIPAKQASRLYEFVNNGGGIIFVLGNRVKPHEFNSQLEKILPAKLAHKYSTGPEKRELYIGEMEKQHPIFNVFQGVHNSYFLTTPFSGFFQVTPRETSHTLIALEDKNPLLIEGAVGKGRTLLFASSLNMDWNDLPLKSVFLPFCQQMVKYCMGYEESQNAFMVGEVIPLNKLNPFLDRAMNKISKTSGSFSQSWKVSTPSGEKIDLNDADLIQTPFFNLEEPGFYQTKVHNFNNIVAVNIDPRESNLKKIDPEKVLASLKRVTEEKAASKPMEASIDQRKAWEGKQSIWWYLLALTLLVLMIESYLANRYYRNTTTL
jgi:uncharacterized membrane protein